MLYHEKPLTREDQAIRARHHLARAIQQEMIRKMAPGALPGAADLELAIVSREFEER